MQNPKEEIEDVLDKLITTKDPDEQRKAMVRYFAENAAFQSPVYNISPHQQSREDALGVYQWLRIISPTTRLHTTNIIFDERSQTLVVEGNVFFPIRFFPTEPKPAKVLIHMKLKKTNNTYRIISQEYFYHPDQFTNHFLPIISPFVRLGLSTFAYTSAVSAKIAQVLGIWRVSDTGKGHGGSHTNPKVHAPHGNGNRRNSDASHSSDETRIGTSDTHSGGEAGHEMKTNQKERKRKSVSGRHH